MSRALGPKPGGGRGRPGHVPGAAARAGRARAKSVRAAREARSGLPILPPFPPMEALPVSEIPEGAGWQYEPKWDGFRCLVFRDGDRIQLQSRSGQPLARYFPEVVAAVAATRAPRFVLDGEIVIPAGEGLSFDDLLQRIHPAASRVQALARDKPARYVAFDLLVDECGRPLLDEPLPGRRAKLEEFFARHLAANGTFHLSPAAGGVAVARSWLEAAGGALDGVIAKRTGIPYAAGERTGMVKIKRRRTADCVVGGFRGAAGAAAVDALLLGLYDAGGRLHHVGFTATLSAAERRRLAPELRKLVEPPGFTGRTPGPPSRWGGRRAAAWEPLRPVVVVEVEYDHFTGGRFRHGTRFLRVRPEKAPAECTFDQMGGSAADRAP